jgi:branched-chain amino acid transport system permease protein
MKTSLIEDESAAKLPLAARLRPWQWWLLGGVLLIVLPHVPGLSSSFGHSLLSQMGIAGILALSYNMLLGQTGLLSFGHAVYFGLGGYVAIHFMRAINAGLPVPIVLVPLVGALGGLGFAILFGSFSTRRAGTVFAMITLGLGELVVAASLTLTHFFGGEEGITANRTHGPLLFGFNLAPQIQVYYVVAFWFAVSVGSMYAFTRTPLGRMCNAVRDNPERAAFIGYNPQRIRFMAFSLAGLFAGVAGGLHAINYEIVAAESLSASRSGTVLLMTYIGGVGNFFGPVLGSVIITWLQVSLSDYTAAWQLYFGALFILTVIFAPGGLASLIAMHGPLVRARKLHRMLPVYAVALVPGLFMAFGGVLLLEILYRLATKPELGTQFPLFGVSLNVARPWPWLVGSVLLAGGFAAFRSTWGWMARTWNSALPVPAAEEEQ